jgi:hypothetical protein
MKIVAVAVGLAICLPVSANVIDFLQIRYEGTVSSVSDAFPEYSVGDRLSGTLLVDLRRAPPDSKEDPRWGAYVNFPSVGDSSFVTGYAPSRGFSADTVLVTNGLNGPTDTFTVEDSQFGLDALADGRARRFEDSIWVSTRQNLDFLDDVDIVQSFDLHGPDVGRGMLSRTRELYEDGKAVLGSLLQGTVEFVMQRFSVRPGRCSAS